MKRSVQAFLIAVGFFLGMVGAASFAQTPVTYKFLCQSVGTGQQEPLGDRDGHNLSVITYSCRVEGGPLDGGLVTGNAIYEWDKINATGLTGNGVVRKPGAAAVLQLADFKNTLTMADRQGHRFSGNRTGDVQARYGISIFSGWQDL